MSGEGPESIPTSADRRSKRPVKKRALTPVSAQAAGLDALFAKPDQTIKIPVSADVARLRGSGGGAPPEIISNVQGSSSGAGSGEFHVYKASRRREYARLRELEEDAARDRDAIDFEKEKREREARDDEKTKRNREKREKAKARKAKSGKNSGGNGGGAAEVQSTAASSKPVGPSVGRDGDDEEDSERSTNAAAANGDKDDENRATNGASGKANGASGWTSQAPVAQEPLQAAEGPGLLIQDDDD
ncbi:uncharacterized protein SPSK_01942 [Sporothrix schenckii 1099-18]|uniref:DUF1168 domain protein n=1 Tax=Sporothrix schenckii 1099-18 TaxID=1397361 RepID=A0A0F2MDU4_SPOSC|nr:uncharacterized protein SPSK_01942 [Sporothrix schenckii 1099-18]KJR87000.1 hypothetical protein SPSK_01942 [Sporothrix schenckii 1099-18]